MYHELRKRGTSLQLEHQLPRKLLGRPDLGGNLGFEGALGALVISARRSSCDFSVSI